VIPKSFDEEQNEMVIREFNVIKELDHPNVVKTYALFETDTHFNIVTDMISGGELYDLLQSEFTEDEVRDLMKAMLSCMNYCHKNNVVHRDLKPENILIEENQNFSRIKVIDFGLSAFFNTEENTTFTRQVGSSYYMSPQVIEGRYTQKCDIWSCGVIAFVCLGGYAPFEGEDEVETAESILDSEHTGVVFDDPVWDDFSDEALDFIQYLMTYNEAERPTAEIALQHPWFQMGKRLSLEDESEIRESARHSIERLQSFHTHDSKLKQCTYSLIASQILRKEQKEEVEEMFRNLDKDCDGKISGDDMRAIYKEHYDTELSDDDLDAIMFEVNLSATGAISYSEFVIASMLEKGLVSEHNLELAFRMIDKEDCGYLCFDNLKGILNVDDSMESYVNKRIIGPADLDQDGKISLKEFKALFAAAESPAKYHIRRRQSLQAAPKNLITGRRQSVRLSDRKSLRVSQILNQSDVAGIVADLTDSNESMLNSEPTFSSLLHIFEKNGSTLSECGISGGSIPNTLQWDNDEEKWYKQDTISE